MSGAAEALQGAIDLLTRFYESPSLAHSNALVLIDQELPKLRKALEEVELTEKLMETSPTPAPTGAHLEQLT